MMGGRRSTSSQRTLDPSGGVSDNENEYDGFPLVVPQAWRGGGLEVSVGGEMHGE